MQFSLFLSCSTTCGSNGIFSRRLDFSLYNVLPKQRINSIEVKVIMEISFLFYLRKFQITNYCNYAEEKVFRRSACKNFNGGAFLLLHGITSAEAKV